MSAFMVSPHHLNYLVSFASDRRTSYYVGPAEGRRHIDGNEQETVNKLYQANCDSLTARYNDRPGTFGPPPPFAYRGDAEPVQVLKACACFDYQACEVEDYDKTEAATIIDAIRHAAIGQLRGYDGAEWCIEDGPAREVVRLSDLCKKK